MAPEIPVPRPAGAQPRADTHILVVDDDAQIRQLAAKLLREHGFRASVAKDGREMWQLIESTPVDLVVLDIMLPGRNGLDLCREIRGKTQLPIIMVTALGSDTDRIVGLEIGADDYLSKPFNPRELVARVNAVLRRAQTAATGTPKAVEHVLKFDGWALDIKRRELTNPSGVVIDLSTGEYDLLLTFLEAPQRVLTRDHLMDSAKNRIATGYDRAIDIQVSRLRKKLDISDDGQTIIKTVRGSGYMFVPAVTRS